MRFSKLLDSEDTLTSAGEMKSSGTAHSAEAQNDNVEILFH